MDDHRGRKRPGDPLEIEDFHRTVKHTRRISSTPSPAMSPHLRRDSSPLTELPQSPAFPGSAESIPGSPAEVNGGDNFAADGRMSSSATPPPADALFGPNVTVVDVPRPPNPYAWPKDAPPPTVPGQHAAWTVELAYKLPTWVFKCPFNFRPGQFPKVFDAKAACFTADGKYVVTTGTSTFVPEPVWGRISLARCADGSFGQHDYMHWPQIFVDERGLRYLPAMPRQSSAELDDGDMFTPMPAGYFVVTHSVTEVPLGVVVKDQREKLKRVISKLKVLVDDALDDDEDRHDELRWLWIALTTSWERLAYPATRRDLVVAYCNVQRVHRTIRAYLTWYTVLCGPSSCPRPSPHGLMGAFTTDLTVATTLMKMGCPVWHMRRPTTFTEDHVVVAWTNFVSPPKSLNETGVFSGGALLEDMAGPRHLRFIRVRAFNYHDVEKVPFPAKWAPFAPPASSSSSKKVQGRASCASERSGPPPNAAREEVARAGPSGRSTGSKPPPSASNRSASMAEQVQNSSKPRRGPPPSKTSVQPRQRLKKGEATFEHKWMPAAIQSWIEAIDSVDEAASSVPCDRLWPYWFPEPTLCIRSKAGDRVAQMIRTWLTVRPAWLSVQRDGSANRAERSASATNWRTFLTAGPERAQREEEVRAKVGRGEALTAVQRAKVRCFEAFENKFKGHNLAKNEQPSWFGNTFPSLDGATCLTEDAHEVDVPMRQVIWELHELSFRAELSELDRYFFPWNEEGETRRLQRDEHLAKVFGTRHLFAAQYIPSTPVGLAARDCLDRVEALEALRRLLVEWPEAPPSFGARLTPRTARDTVEAAEKAMAVFYCQSFYRESGRLPVLPRLPPPRTSSL